MLELRKAAVVIGVGNVGDGLFTPLNSAEVAKAFKEKILDKNGYDIELVTDSERPVKASDVEEAINKFVSNPPTYDLLLIYFCGHGFWHARSDHWLLSGAPTLTSQAVNLNGAMDLARYSGIPNVIFISDACRSISHTRQGSQIRGIDAFPNYSEVTHISKIDYLKATSEDRAAYEIDGKSVLTSALTLAYESPSNEIVRIINNVHVVPNRQLENFLQSKVNELLKGTNKTQQIEVNVPSNDDVFISIVLGEIPQDGRDIPSPSPDVDNIGVAAAMLVNDALSVKTGLFYADDPLREFKDDLLREFKLATLKPVSQRLPQGDIEQIKSHTGFLIHGTVVDRSVCTNGQENATCEILAHGDGNKNPGVIEVRNVKPAVSISVQMENGKCAIFAAIYGYIGHIIVDAQGVSNVSYIPSADNDIFESKYYERLMGYQSKKQRIDYFRSIVALAIDHNTFRIQNKNEAKKLAQQIRTDKATDPTLGIYAAHAYYQSGNEKEVLDVLKFMRKDLHADLFDVNALASRQLNQKKDNSKMPIVPFCPMLTQTWSLLRPRGIIISPIFDELTPYLCNSLWTTFQSEAADKIFQAIQSGELQ